MANTKSAKKAARQATRRTVVNKARRTRLRSSVRKVEEAIASGDKEAAAAALKEAEPVIARTAQKGIVHHNSASRKMSRLAKRVSAMGKSLAPLSGSRIPRAKRTRPGSAAPARRSSTHFPPGTRLTLPSPPIP